MPAMNRNKGKMVSWWRNPYQGTWLIWRQSQLFPPSGKRRQIAEMTAAKPMMNIMSKPRRVSSERSLLLGSIPIKYKVQRYKDNNLFRFILYFWTVTPKV